VIVRTWSGSRIVLTRARFVPWLLGWWRFFGPVIQFAVVAVATWLILWALS
jgi:hypothetical protein